MLINRDPEKTEGHGGADKPDDKPKPADRGKVQPEAPPADDVDAKIQAAVEAERKRLQAEADQKAKEAEAEQEKKRGEYEKLYQKAEADLKTLRADLRRRDVADKVRDYLREKHAAYAGVEKYILPLVEFDEKTTEQEIAQRVRAAADQYVKDNPRAGAAGSPEGPRRDGRINPGADLPARQAANAPPRRPFQHLSRHG